MVCVTGKRRESSSAIEWIVARANLQQDLNHFDDGPEQVARDEKMKAFVESKRNTFPDLVLLVNHSVHKHDKWG